MNILVTGAGGQLGTELRLLSVYTAHTFFFTDVVAQDISPTHSLDITDGDAVSRFVSEHAIDTIINCAAYTNVDAAESDAERCDLINHRAVEHLALAAQAADALLVHISTDYVFGAEPYNTPCGEDRKGTPTGVYGATKLRGEQAIRRIGCKHLILRTAWLYSPFGKNFVKTMLSLTASRPEVKVVIDQCGTPTSAADLAAAILAVIARPLDETQFGTYHYSDEGVCSWYDFAVAIAHEAGHTDCKILPCLSSEFPSPVKRPAYSVLDKTKFKETFDLRIPYWLDSLRTCIARLQPSAS